MAKLAAFLFLCLTSLVFAAEPAGNITGIMDWESLKIDATITIDLKGANIPIPTGRSIAEDSLFSQFFTKISVFLLSIPVDSSSTLGDWVEKGLLNADAVDSTIQEAEHIPSSFSKDFSTMSASYTIGLAGITHKLVSHRSPSAISPALTPIETGSYTGILIIAQEELPIHGRQKPGRLVPCLFPKVWDTDMNLVYEKNMVNPEAFSKAGMIRYTKPENIFQKTPSGISSSLEKFIGDKPLRIIARSVFGISPTDPIIDATDALAILSSEENRMLLREGKVAIVVNQEVLSKRISD
ncbi:MAG: polymerase [Spirochaetaceae bacterium]|jgi:hypothetical protein|nr:polymerase [Spirochaetaceae bacterium]